MRTYFPQYRRIRIIPNVWRYVFIFLLVMTLLQKETFCQVSNGSDSLHKVSMQDVQQNINFLSGWKFITRDISQGASTMLNDSDWKTAAKIDACSTLPGWNGNGWFRLHILIDSSLYDKTVSLFIQQRCAMEVYVDGQLVHAIGRVGRSIEDEHVGGTEMRPIPVHFSAQEHHVIAVRYSNHAFLRMRNLFGLQIIIWNGDGFLLGLRDYSQHLQLYIRSHSFRLVVGMIPLGILLFLALQHGLLYAFSVRERVNLFLALFSLSMAALCFSMMYRHISTAGIDIMTWNEVFVVLEIAFVGMFLSAIVDEVVYDRTTKSVWLVTFPNVVLLFISRLVMPVAIWNIHILIALCVETWRICQVILSTRDAANPRGLVIVGIGMLACFAGGAGVTLISIFQLHENLFLYAPAYYLMFLSVPISLAFFMARRFDRINNELSEQLEYTKALSDRTIEQEQEKQRLVERQKLELERVVEERTEELQKLNALLNEQKQAIQEANMQLLKKNVNMAAEQEKSENLLHNILPEAIAQRLKNGEKTIADKHDSVTVLFADIAGFTRFASNIDPQELVSLLDKVFSEFDALIERYGVEKIKTIGDAYMVVSGLQHHKGDHTKTMAKLAIEMQDAICRLSENMGVIGLTVRIGIHHGEAVAGVIGKKKPNYDLWGDTVNIASRMESHGEAGKIHVTEEVFKHLAKDFLFRSRGEIRIKGKGAMKTYFLESERKHIPLPHNQNN